MPDDEVHAALAERFRAPRPGGALPLGSHAGEGMELKTDGRGGHPMKVYMPGRSPARVRGGLRSAGFTVEAEKRMWVEPRGLEPQNLDHDLAAVDHTSELRLFIINFRPLTALYGLKCSRSVPDDLGFLRRRPALSDHPS